MLVIHFMKSIASDFGIDVYLSFGRVASDPSRTITAGSPPPAPAGYHWESQPKLSDEFKGNHLDASKWLPYLPYYRGRATESHLPVPITSWCSDGRLELLASAMVTNLIASQKSEQDHLASFSLRRLEKTHRELRILRRADEGLPFIHDLLLLVSRKGQ